MPIASQVKSLTEDIEASYGARVAAVSDIIKETQQNLGSFRHAHQRMASDLRGFLSSDLTGRVTWVQKRRAENVKELKEMAKNLKEMAKNLSEHLSLSEKERVEEATALLRKIKGVVGTIEKDIANTLSDFRSSHKEMAAGLKAALSRETKERINKVKDLQTKFTQEQKERASSLDRELSSFRRNLEKMVEEMRTDFFSDHCQARTHWQNLAKVMAAKRAGKPIPGARAEMGVSTAVKAKAEKTFQEGEEKTFQEGLKVGVLAVVQAHPGGIRLTEIGKALNVAYIRVTKPLKQLVVEMRITKRDSEYFPA